MKQEELSNPEGGETPEQEDVSAALRKMAEVGESGKKISRRGFLGGMLKAAVGFTVAGRTAEALAKDGEKGEDDKEKETKKKNVAFLRNAFQKISGGGIGKNKKSGDLIIHIGDGKYNGLKTPELNKLTDSVGPHREYVEMLDGKLKAAEKPEEKQKYQKLIDAASLMANSTVRGDIIKANHPVKVEDLPPELKTFENNRLKEEEEKKKAAKEMTEGSIIQPIDKGNK
jgi:hypothetical protein